MKNCDLWKVLKMPLQPIRTAIIRKSTTLTWNTASTTSTTVTKSNSPTWTIMKFMKKLKLLKLMKNCDLWKVLKMPLQPNLDNNGSIRNHTKLKYCVVLQYCKYLKIFEYITNRGVTRNIANLKILKKSWKKLKKLQVENFPIIKYTKKYYFNLKYCEYYKYYEHQN